MVRRCGGQGSLQSTMTENLNLALVWFIESFLYISNKCNQQMGQKSIIELPARNTGLSTADTTNSGEDKSNWNEMKGWSLFYLDVCRWTFIWEIPLQLIFRFCPKNIRSQRLKVTTCEYWLRRMLKTWSTTSGSCWATFVNYDNEFVVNCINHMKLRVS